MPLSRNSTVVKQVSNQPRPASVSPTPAASKKFTVVKPALNQSRPASASPTPAKPKKVPPPSNVKVPIRSRSSSPKKSLPIPKPIKMATQDDLDLLKVEVDSLKSRITTAEETIKQQQSEIETLNANVTRLEAARISVKKPQPATASPARTRRDINAKSASTARRASITLSTKTPQSRVTKSATHGNMPGSNMTNGTSKSSSITKPKYRPASMRSSGALAKTKEATFDRESGVMRLYLRGRAVTLHAPLEECESFDISHPNDAPREHLKLEWAHGFRGKQILLLPTGELVFACAGVVVLMQPSGRSQRFYTEHTDDVKSLALHPDKVTMASGQVAGHDREAGKPHVRLWNSVTLQTIRVLGLDGPKFDRAVIALSFSKADSGSLLAAVDDSNEHVMSVYNWSNGQRLADTRVTTDALLGIDFNPTANSPAEIATWGRFGLSWWTVAANESTALNRTQSMRITRLKQATFDAKDRPRAISCGAYTNDGAILVAGDSNGGLSWWTRGSARMGRLLPGAHSGAISAVFISPEGDWLLSAGFKDHTINKWDITEEPPSIISKLVLPSSASVRALQSSGSGGGFYIGTSQGSILSASAIEEGTKVSTMIQGHNEEVWGVASHPVKATIAASVGYDKILVLWDISRKSSICARELPSAAHAVAFHPQADTLAIGLRTGEWIAVDVSEELAITDSPGPQQSPAKIVYQDHPAHEQIECLAFSPDGNFVAVGSRDQQIYVYSVSENNFARVSRCSGHSSYITHIDWTKDSKYLRSNSGDYEVLTWEASTGRQIVFGSISKDQLHSSEVLEMLRTPESWATHTCTLSFTSAGIWPDGADGTDINGSNKANNKDLMVVGDDFGKVRLFRWPCSKPRSHSHSAVGHSSHVTSVVFSADDSRVITGGGRDASILQWTLSGSTAD